MAGAALHSVFIITILAFTSFIEHTSTLGGPLSSHKFTCEARNSCAGKESAHTLVILSSKYFLCLTTNIHLNQNVLEYIGKANFKLTNQILRHMKST